jgi:DNA invertase Pin-like site-specific DNA recombinase
MTKAIGYIRVSTQEQATQGYSLDAQTAKLKAYADLYDIELIEIVVDAGVSAKTLKREGLTKVLTTLENGGADAVLIFKLDRLTRSVKDWNILIEKYFTHKALLSVSDQIDTRTAAGRLCLNVLMSVAQWERETIGERTSTALQYKKSQGGHCGAFPYGYETVEKELTAISDEYAAIALMREMRAQGAKLQAIADELNLQGIATKRGGTWHPTTIKKIMERAA